MELFGFILSCGIIVIIELFDTSIKDQDYLEKITKSKTLVRLPKSTLDTSDRFKILRVNLNECRKILVTSPEKNDGKSFVSFKLAESYAKLGRKVLLIDLNKNNNENVKDYNGDGLIEYLKSNENSTTNYIAGTNIKNLDMLLAGKDLTNQEELLESYKMKDTLKLLENLYDVLIIDSNNVLESACTLAITRLVRYSILVVSERKTKVENIIRAKSSIENVGGELLGIVYNNSMKK